MSARVNGRLARLEKHFTMAPGKHCRLCRPTEVVVRPPRVVKSWRELYAQVDEPPPERCPVCGTQLEYRMQPPVLPRFDGYGLEGRRSARVCREVLPTYAKT